MPKFSIIVPVYRVEEYLDECVKSVVDQTYQNFELILVNDGSPDSSGEICDRWGKQDPRITVLRKENGGLSSARNWGLPVVTGEYVLFLDSDDYWISGDVLERLAQRLAQTQPDVLVYNLQKDFSGKREQPYFPENLDMPGDLSNEQTAVFMAEHDLWTACAWNKAIRSDLFRDGQLRFVHGITSEDVDWCLRLALAAKRFDYLGICAVNYRQRSNSITGSISMKKIRQVFENVCECVRLLEASGDQRELLRIFTGYQYGILLYNIASLSTSSDKKALISQAKPLAYLLEWSSNAKIRSMCKIRKLCGFSMMLTLLHIKNKIDNIRYKRSG